MLDRTQRLSRKNGVWPLQSQASARRNSGPDRERDATLDIYDLKGVVEELFEQLGIRGVQWQRNESAGPLYVEVRDGADWQASRRRNGTIEPDHSA